MTKEIKDLKTKSVGAKKEKKIPDLMEQARTTADAERPIPGDHIPEGYIPRDHTSDGHTSQLPARKKPFPQG